MAVVDLLLSRGGPALLLAKDILGCTPVHLAAVQNQVRQCSGLTLAVADTTLQH